ncbi:glutamine-hydrolyzing GMP synthase [Spiroplasma citri]|uniref:GMP synthase [glutamine-hydrolyzing] n=1 Tax=Spiroplasma citri TaxID=2133 RepID=A0AAJ4JXR9_SPICI|nr:glutamine-hydrolyzing GMP synthase [Spiroplasma citri]APE74293.1 GMP synthase [Spiroplasma citri]QED24252.1 glutamine-hydrolyzing GMP synthase [Spiroplasma citri]QIA66520.1 glutamine-hydrolyzing GMP synthase [Spiroplasma citri]QIA68398.1 glutamine-hydrolyzing GMP synthase [Spiroplasma citri]QIA72506.1 glutamine-hydrolyzing GMP synthase [Spiroplasma citri]
MKTANKIIILDFGSQYTQLIARRIRHLEVYCEVWPYNTTLEKIKTTPMKGIILSGGPASVYAEDAFLIDKKLFELEVPILGICYGMQLISHLHGGTVQRATKQEFGFSELIIDNQEDLFAKVPIKSQVWMSHADHIEIMPTDFIQIAHSENSISAIKHLEKKIYGLQFHPEVTHTLIGEQLLSNFVFNICGCEPTWKITEFISTATTEIKGKVGSDNVVLALSGGVDSSVCAVLLHKAIGKQLTCIFVDTGLLRQDSGWNDLQKFQEKFKLNIIKIAAQERFLTALKGVTNPEQKRKIIGNLFIEIFNEEAIKIKNVKWLGQGTIYPDVIESISVKGPSATIKSHHNVGGLPKDLPFQLIEPLRELFKDEVRRTGEALGIDSKFVYKHPFPGPGLAVRIIGEITAEKVALLQAADQIFIDELYQTNLYDQVAQAFVVLLPVQSVGVMGDVRTYGYTAVVRSVDTTDFMTANWSRLPFELLEKVSTRIVSEVHGINRVTYDITSKPPGTIEWE